MIPGTDGNRINVLVPIGAFAFQHFPKNFNPLGWLMLGFINATRKSVRQVLFVSIMNKYRESKGLFPKEVDHVLKIIDPLLEEKLEIGKRVRLVAIFSPQIFPDSRRRELRLTHAH